jgi:hypothetical protein
MYTYYKKQVLSVWRSVVFALIIPNKIINYKNQRL